jgi:hypothetical protein
LYGKATLNVYNDECNTNFGTFNSEDNLIGKSEDFKDLNFDYIKKYGSICMKTEDIDGIEKKLSSTSQDNYDEDHYFYLDIYNNSLKGTENMNNWTTYVRVYPNIHGGINIQYWYFFPYNDPESNLTAGGGKHEGDWEHITVQLDENNNPLFVFYAEHGTNDPGRKHCWEFDERCLYTLPGQEIEEPYEISKEDDTHPIVYIGSGTHASYASIEEINKLKAWNEGLFEPGIKWITINSSLVNLGEIPNYGNNLNYFMLYAGRWGSTRPAGGVLGDTGIHAYSPYTLTFQRESWIYDQVIK